MSGPKRLKPIRISLTEEQIAEVIRNTVKSRKGFNVQSLEDRIAPSRIGLPIGGGLEDTVGGGDTPDVVGGEDPPLPGGGEPPLPGDGTPPLPGDGTPPLPGDGTPPLPGDGTPPLPGLNPEGGDPGIPGGDPFADGAGGPGFEHHSGPHDPFGAQPQFGGGGPDDGIPQPGDEGGRFRPGAQGEGPADPRLRHMEPEQNVGPNEVSEEELQRHRQAILRQLRGGQA